MADWRTASTGKTNGEIVNATFNAQGGFEDYQGAMYFNEQYWPGQAQIITEGFDKVVPLEDVEATLPPNLRNENWK